MAFSLFSRHKEQKLQDLQRKNAILDFYIRGNNDILSSSTSYTTLATRGYVENPIVYRCINRIASAASMVGIKLFKYGKDGKKTEIKEHEILTLLEEPNPMMSYADMVENIFINRGIGGEAFLRATEEGGEPLELWPIRPNNMSVEYDPKADAIVYTVLNAKKYYARGIDAYKSEIFHWKNFNPLNDLRGLSPMIPAGRSILAFNSALEWNKCLIDNGANPSGALTSEAVLTDEQFIRLKKQLQEEYSGAKNSGKPLLLEGKMDWKEMSLTPKDMDFNNSLLENARFICTTFGVPSQLVGIRGESTYSNYEHALLSFWQETLAPECLKYVLALNRWLLDWYDDKSLWLELDYSNIDGLEPRKQQKVERVTKAGSLLTVNESRIELGYDEIPDGDVILIDSNKIPLEDAGADLTGETEEDYDQAVDDIRGQRNKPAAEATDPEEQPKDKKD